MNKALKIPDYAEDIHLFDEFIPELNSGNDKESIVDSLLRVLKQTCGLGDEYQKKRRLLRAVLNTLAPQSLSNDAVLQLDNLLQLELREKVVTDACKLSDEITQVIENTKLVIWQGDITSLKIDAIVNAANNQLLGCFQPLHKCIDNAIHSAAGVQLRDDCNAIMRKQGILEPSGFAKITRAYNLPSKYVLHTVGPIVQGKVSSQNKSDITNAYINCLEICKQVENIKSIAFCGISTGVFGYPAREAAQVAYETVNAWLRKNPDCMDLVVFNVFSERDKLIYESLITES